MMAYVLALSAVTLTAVGQVLLKSAALLRAAGRPVPPLAELLRLGLGYAAMLGALALSSYTLRQLDVSIAVSLTAICYPMVIGLSRVLFGERLAARQWAGLVLICCGVAVYNLA